MENKSEKRSILIADDSEINRILLRRILGNDYNIDEAADGEEALTAIRTHGGKYSLLILDNHMPKMSGLEVLEVVHNNPWLCQLPVIMISADKDTDFVESAYGLGVLDFFFVPYAPAVVLHRVQYAIAQYERTRKSIYNSLHSGADFYFVLMQINLDTGHCMIVNTSEEQDIWDKDISVVSDEAVELFVAYGYIHPEDQAEFLAFTKTENIRRQMESGAHKIHLRYRRKYQDNYYWALMEIMPSVDYSESNPVVIMASRNIQDVTAEHTAEMESLGLNCISADYCNITKDVLYHSEQAHYIQDAMRDYDTISGAVRWGGGLIPRREDREQFIDTFMPENLIRQYHSGVRRVCVSHLYGTPEDELRLYQTTLQMFQNTYTKDIEGIYYIEDISQDYLRGRIEESLYTNEYLLICIINLKTGTIHFHKRGELFSAFTEGTARDYRTELEWEAAHYIPRHSHEHFLQMADQDTVVKNLETHDSYEFTVETTGPTGVSATMRYVYRYLERELGIVLGMVRNISKLAEQDTVTDRMNATGFERNVKHILDNAADPTEYAIVCVDIMEFKALNMRLGYEGGNELLRGVSDRLGRSSLCPVVTARMMADQFACLVERRNLNEQALAQLCEFYTTVNHRTFRSGLSCGIYCVPNGEESVRTMYDRARIAERRVAAEPSTPWRFYDSSMDGGYLQRLFVLEHLDSALENEEFKVYYQPIFDAQTKKIVSAESLVRWQSADKGLISPGVFVPVLEEKGLVSKVDLYVAVHAMDFMRKRYLAGKSIRPVSINLSRMDFFDTKMIETLVSDLRDIEIDTRTFRFEVTESAFVDISGQSLWVLDAFRDMGCKILIDDFGTGYSSMVSLSRHRFDILKIDKTFTDGIGVTPNVEAIIISIIEMAHRMNSTVVAEGVETAEQYEFLRDHGCDYIQGFYFSRPLPQEEFAALLDAEKPCEVL